MLGLKNLDVTPEAEGSRMLAAIPYVLSILTSPFLGLLIGLVFFFAFGRDRFIRIHALQLVLIDILLALLAVVVLFLLFNGTMFISQALGPQAGQTACLLTLVSPLVFLALYLTLLGGSTFDATHGRISDIPVITGIALRFA